MEKLFKISMAALLSGSAMLGAADFSASKLEDYPSRTRCSYTATSEGFIVKQPKDKGSVSMYGKNTFDVSPDKKYCASAEIRLPEGCTESGTFYLALVCLDKNGRECTVTEVNAHPKTLTELAAPVKVGDKTVKIKDGSKWIKRYPHIAFNAKEDFSDLPNRELSSLVKSIEKSGNVWVLTLAQPMKKAYPAGTKIRNHADGCSYRYVIGKAPAAQWVTCKLNLKGIAKNDQDPGAYNKFRAGTAKVKFNIFAFGSGVPFNAEFRRIKISEVK